MSIFTWLADAVLILHFVYVAAVVIPVVLIPVGWFAEWSWVRSRPLRITHLLMIGFVVFEVLVGMTCPLTLIENRLLQAAHETSYQGDFIAHWISQIMYWDLPAWFFVTLYLSFFALVGLLWFWCPPRRGNFKV